MPDFCHFAEISNLFLKFVFVLKKIFSENLHVGWKVSFECFSTSSISFFCFHNCCGKGTETPHYTIWLLNSVKKQHAVINSKNNSLKTGITILLRSVIPAQLPTAVPWVISDLTTSCCHLHLQLLMKSYPAMCASKGRNGFGEEACLWPHPDHAIGVRQRWV